MEHNKVYVITGKLASNNKKGSLTLEAHSKQEIWNHPEDFGFTKIFKVVEGS